MKRLFRWSALALLLLFAAAAAFAYFSWSPGAPVYTETPRVRGIELPLRFRDGSLASAGDIDRVWRRDFSTLPDWRVITEEPKGTYLAEISDASRCIRGKRIAGRLI